MTHEVLTLCIDIRLRQSAQDACDGLANRFFVALQRFEDRHRLSLRLGVEISSGWRLVVLRPRAWMWRPHTGPPITGRLNK